MTRRQIPWELVRFASVGIVNSAIDFTIFSLCAGPLGWPLVAANLVAWSIAVTFSYAANGRWTFRQSWADMMRPSPYGHFVVGNALGFVLATLVLLVLAQGMHVAVAKAISLGVGFAVNYLAAKHIAFGTTRP